MKNNLITAMLLMTVPFVTKGTVIEVLNSTPELRMNEIVEVNAELIPLDNFSIINSKGEEIPWQKTYNGKIIFPATVAPNGVSSYSLSEKAPAPVDTIVYGRCFPERADDMSWENDWAAYRAYGPALQRNGERGFGYDVWTKSVETPILEKRYFNHLHRNLSFHKNHGEGMDVYEVGPTLGGGTCALLDENGEILYPWCYTSYEILDNGPLRFTVRLDYAGDPTRETRTISLDAGDPLNHTVVEFPGAAGKTAVFGFPVHRPTPVDSNFEQNVVRKDGILAYADPTQGDVNENGVIFLGCISLNPESRGMIKNLPEPAGNAFAQALISVPVDKDGTVDYYWGSSWSLGKTKDMDEWIKTLTSRRNGLENPLKVKVNL